jgi:hypothetical protein
VPRIRSHSTVIEPLLARLQRLEATRIKLESLLLKDKVSRRDIEHIYGALFLSAVTAFEGMLEVLFMKLLTRRLKHPRRIRALVEFESDIIARRVVFGGRSYVDWLPYEQTTGRAKLFFASGRPFTHLEKPEKKSVEAWCAIRNALAHQSRFAQRRFHELIVAPRTLLPREKRPSSFLRSLHSTAPSVTQYEQIVGEMVSVAKKITR